METIPVALCVILRNINLDHCELYLQTRREEGPLNGLLEFPGGKIKSEESPDQAARRETLEETGIEIKEVISLKNYQYQYSDRNVSLNVFLADGSSIDLKEDKWHRLNFQNKEQIISKMPEANKQIVDDISEFVQDQLPLWSHLWN